MQRYHLWFEIFSLFRQGTQYSILHNDFNNKTPESNQQTMLCSSCQTPIESGIEVFQKTWIDDLEQHFEKPEQSCICAKCLSGWNVPAFRPKEKTWEFGIVEAYNDETKQHYLRFVRDDAEWVSVETNAFAQYIAYCAKSGLTQEQGDELLLVDDDEESGSYVCNDDHTTTFSFDFSSHAPTKFETSPCKQRRSDKLQILSVPESDKRCSILEIPQLEHTTSPCRKRQKLERPAINHYPEAGFAQVQHAATSALVGTANYRYGTPTKQSGGHTFSTPRTSQTPLLLIERNGTQDTPKHYQKMWSPQEDKILLEIVATNNYKLKWPQIAKAIPGRTGKQCRERYMNHLKPSLRLAEWSPFEDALIFQVFCKQGSRWALMSKLIVGRTDNSIKNRYHHLKRRFEKRIQSLHRSDQIDDLARALKTRHGGGCPRGDDLMPLMCKYMAMQIKSSDRSRIEADQASFFGPWQTPKTGESCRRCGLMVPSAQTGRLICESSGWCKTCSHVSTCLSGNMLRAIHSSIFTSQDSKN